MDNQTYITGWWVSSCKRPASFGVVLEKRDHDLGGIPSRLREHSGGRGILLDQNFSRMKTSFRGFQPGSANMGRNISLSQGLTTSWQSM